MTTPAVPDRAPRWTDHQVDQVIGRLLQVGVAMATVVVIIGSVLLIARHGHETVDHRVFRGAAATLTSVGAIVHAAFAGDPLAITQLGLVLLIATPIARVALTLIAFVAQRDWLYTGLTAVVLAILAWGLLH